MSDLAVDSAHNSCCILTSATGSSGSTTRFAWPSKVDRPNVGVMFNLCHWLRVDPSRDYRSLLDGPCPGSGRSRSTAPTCRDDKPGWDHYIQPLDRGSFDVAELLRTLDNLGYKGPVGLQCFGIGGDTREHLVRSMAAWRKMKE